MQPQATCTPADREATEALRKDVSKRIQHPVAVEYGATEDDSEH